MWKLLWFRKRSYEVWMPKRLLWVLAMDCPFQFTVYGQRKDIHGRTKTRVRFLARPGVVGRYMARRNWMFVTHEGMVYEVVECN